MQGFTLLELLVVLAVLGVVMGMAGLVIGPDPQRVARQEASAFVQWIQHARQQAVLDGQALGVRFERRGYRLVRRTAQGWEAAGALREVALELHLDVEGSPRLAPADAPQVVLASHDEHTPFVLSFERQGMRFATVTSDGFDDPRLER